MIAAAAFIPLLDAFGKILVMTYRVSAGEVALVRLVLQAGLILPVLLLARGRSGLSTTHLWLNLLRGALLAFSGVAFFAALEFMPLADASAVFLIQPMIVTLLSGVLLKERIGWQRIAAAAVGFIGALVIVRPSYAVFGVPSLFPVVAAVCAALYMIVTRKVSHGAKPLTMLFYSGLGGSVVLSAVMVVTLPFDIPALRLAWPASAAIWQLLLLTGLIGAIGHLLFILAYRLAPASVLAPFGYVEIVSAVLLGYLIFGEVPDGAKWFGMAIIVGSGLFIYAREKRLARNLPPPPLVH
ncbi:drug/metabolite transporter (DMT)-like permease [Aurantimonas endophytica]|uniref:Drug/metabolite transporter (DMT)-like permease n=2 Tax=Aurantimonas endophytica TaxID=1522175 RepID=A0A7W6HA45_9HYPH|nr:drug/metabolite transporter (DMT)-like permease [Aurantimonas endophytica]MCO6402919.1 EamA family transporter [Aurantimonas endophytica]